MTCKKQNCSIEEETRRGQTKMILAQLAGVMGKAMYDMQKSQDRSFADMHSRTAALSSRVNAAGVLQCFAVRCSVLQCVVACCSVLQCVAMCCSVLQCSPPRTLMTFCSLFASRCGGCVAVRCSVLPCGSMRCSVLQCVAMQFSADTLALLLCPCM